MNSRFEDAQKDKQKFDFSFDVVDKLTEGIEFVNKSDTARTYEDRTSFQNEDDDIDPPSILRFWWVPFTITATWILLGSIPWWAEHGYPWTLKWGLSDGNAADYGDSFGWINSLFSAMALVGVILTVYLQMQELSSQRKAIRANQREIARAADAQTRMEEAVTRQLMLSETVSILESISGIREHAMFVHENAKTASEREASSRNIEFCNDIQLGLLSNLVASMPQSGLQDVLERRVRNYSIYTESLRLLAEWREAFCGVLDYEEKGGQRKAKPTVIESSARTFVITIRKGVNTFKENCQKLDVSFEEFDSAFEAVAGGPGEELNSTESKRFQDLEKAINNLELKLVNESSILKPEEMETDGS